MSTSRLTIINTYQRSCQDPGISFNRKTNNKLQLRDELNGGCINDKRPAYFFFLPGFHNICTKMMPGLALGFNGKMNL